MSNNTLFDVYIVVDWSAKDDPGPQSHKDDKLKKDNIWIGEAKRTGEVLTFSQSYFRTRARAYQHLEATLKDQLREGKRSLVGFDFAFGYPAGFAELLTGKADWKGVWQYLSEHLEDDELNENNRFKLADRINAKFSGEGPFWGVGRGVELKHIEAKSPWKGVDELMINGKAIQRLRHTDRSTKGTQEVWKLYGAGSVGSQSLTGIPVVWRLRCHETLEKESYIWPFETTMLEKEVLEKKAKVVFAEIFPGQAEERVKKLIKDRESNGEKPKDQLQVWAMTEKLGQADESGELMNWFAEVAALPKVVRSEEAAILKAPAPLEQTPAVKGKVAKGKKTKTSDQEPAKERRIKSDSVAKSQESKKSKLAKKQKQEDVRLAREKEKEEIKKKRESEIAKRKEEREKQRAILIAAREKAKEKKQKEREDRLEKIKAEKAKKEKERKAKKEEEKAKKDEKRRIRMVGIESMKQKKALEEEQKRRHQEQKSKAVAKAKATADKKAREEAKIREAGSLKRHVSPEIAVAKAEGKTVDTGNITKNTNSGIEKRTEGGT